jgi:hypothetical protein
VAVRLGTKIEWDAESLRCPGAAEADGLIRRDYRSGWSL